MAKSIVVDINKCLACKSCEVACALAHSKSKVLEDAIAESPAPQRRVTVEAAGEFGVPIQCRHCIDARCIEICPTGAVQRQSESSPVTIDPELCIGCKMCMFVCNFGILQIEAEGRAVIKCDMCYEQAKEGKLPACVEACPTNALKMVTLKETAIPEKRVSAKNKKEKPARGKKIVVIGSGAAGMMAATTAAKRAGNAEITIVSCDKIAYRRPAIPALIADYIKGPEEAKVFSSQFLAQYNIKLICPAEATSIDTVNKIISISTNGKKEQLPYDRAVIATGSHPLIPPIKGADKKGVCTFTTYEAAAKIVETVKNAKTAVVVGAGFIALEIAEALMHKGLDVYFNVRSRILRKLVEPELSQFLSQRFEQQRLKMLAGESISEIGGKDRVEYIVHKGQKITTNLVVMGTGVKPNVVFVEKSGIQLGPTGAIKVDNQMQTSVPGIYAAGDCAESLDLGTGKFVYSPVGGIGAMAGKIAGVNAAGDDEKTEGFLRVQADEILGLQIYSVGHSSTTAREAGLEVEVHNLDVEQLEEQEYKRKPFEKAKILTDNNERIVGAQLVSHKYGSRLACQLYKAVLESEKREEFLGKFGLPSKQAVQTLIQYEP